MFPLSFIFAVFILKCNADQQTDMGRYVPPDQEGITSANKLAGKHPLGARARHLRTTGALVVRFEMPFAVWCTNCKPHETLIAQGVRFNAEKKKVGNYYSTPIYSFRMRHTLCGGWIEIRTDPKNTAYVVTEGGRKRDTGEDREITGDLGEINLRLLAGDSQEERKDAFARLEGKLEDKRRAETESSRVRELQRLQDRDWEDPYEKSKILRRAFRAERKALQKAEEIKEALKDKMSLGIDLVDETEEDRVRAAMVEFGGVPDTSHASRIRPMFEARTESPAALSKDRGKRGKRPLKGEELIAERKAQLRSELHGNTRAAMDPFLSGEKVWQPEIKKRKVTKIVSPSNADDVGIETSPLDNTNEQPVPTPVEEPAPPMPPEPVPSAAPLVDYASDSE